MEKEIWKEIPGYEGIYQASNLGKIRSLKRNKVRILRPRRSGNGYYNVKLYLNKVSKCSTVHRIVWLAFNGPIPEGMQINHLNENKSDNRLENLSLCTVKENINYGTRTERMAKKHSKPVIQFDINGNFIAEYSSITEAAKVLGKSSPGLIGKVLTGKRNNTYNSKWMYAEDYYNKSMQ